MKKPGKLIKLVGNALGTATEYGIKLTGKTIGSALTLAGREKLGKTSEYAGVIIGNVIGKTVMVSGEVAGNIADLVTNEGFKLAMDIAKNSVKTEVRIYGDSSVFHNPKSYVEVDYNVTK